MDNADLSLVEIITNLGDAALLLPATALLFAFLLRRLMSWLRAEKLWQWALAGPTLALPMAWGVRWASRATDVIGLQGAWRQVAVFLFLGVRGIAERHVLLAMPVAAATSAVLFLIHRAFAQKGES